METCSISECDKPRQCRTWCSMHYARWRRTGTTEGIPRNTIDRFMSYVQKGPDCWLWTGSANLAGYGSFGSGRRNRQNAHRWLWEQLNGKASPKMHLDHLCRNKLCVNPQHMELVTHSENIKRGDKSDYWSSQTHCKRGHPFDEANTRLDRRGRRCRACHREYMRTWSSGK